MSNASDMAGAATAGPSTSTSTLPPASASLYTGANSISKSKSWPEIETGASLLLAWQLKNRRVLIVGGGNVAADRLRSTLPTDAKVTLVCPDSGLGDEARYRVVDERDKWSIDWRDRDFENGDINDEEWDMVLTALDDPELSKHIYSLAKKRRFNINVADVPPLCDFYFGSVIRRGPLQVMISTNGKGPRLANRIRRQIEAGLPANVGEAIEHIGTLRKELRKMAPGKDAETVKKRMEWMVRVTDSWTLDELSEMTPEQQDAILAGWEEGLVAKTFTSASGRWYRRLLCPYWVVQGLNPAFWWRLAAGGSGEGTAAGTEREAQAEKAEERRQKCPVYRGKSAVEPSGALHWLSAAGGAASGVVAVLAIQQIQRRFR